MKFRKDIRLKDHDYSSEGYYFVTICTDYKKKMFAPRLSQNYCMKFEEGVAAGPWSAEYNENTNILERNILDIGKKFSAKVDFYSIMPDHIHMILQLSRQGRETTVSKCSRRPLACNATKLCWIINAFKGWTTRAFKRRVFQLNYYEHVIRDEHSLSRIREYVYNNPYTEKIEWDVLSRQGRETAKQV